MRISAVFIMLLWWSLLSGARAGEETGACAIVSAPEVRHMTETGEVLLVHTLSRIEYAIQHIPGSINIQVDEIGSTDRLPADKSAPVIFYCMGVKCPYSKRACDEAASIGYHNSYWFRGGIPEWYKFNYPMESDREALAISVAKFDPQKSMRIITKEKPFILDVRPKGWRESWGFIANSTYIPLVELDAKLHYIPRDRKILITDGFMKQSTNAARYLIRNGYQVIGVMKGGIARWEKEGFPLGTIESVEFP